MAFQKVKHNLTTEQQQEGRHRFRPKFIILLKIFIHSFILPTKVYRGPTICQVLYQTPEI